MDALEKMLIEQYGVPAEQAKAYAVEINANRAPEGNTVAGKAYGDVAKGELDRMYGLRKKFERFTKIAEAKARGDNLGNPDDERFYRDVTSKVFQQKAAALQTKQHGQQAVNSAAGTASYQAGVAGAGQAGQAVQAGQMRQAPANMAAGGAQLSSNLQADAASAQQANEIQMPAMNVSQPPPQSATSIGPRPSTWWNDAGGGQQVGPGQTLAQAGAQAPKAQAQAMDPQMVQMLLQELQRRGGVQ